MLPGTGIRVIVLRPQELGESIDLAREEWIFEIGPRIVSVRSYARQSRPSKRHKWRDDLTWTPYERRKKDNLKGVPEDVLQEAIAKASIELMSQTKSVYLGGDREENFHHSVTLKEWPTKES